MTVPPLTAAEFPSFERSIRALWAPILLEPIVGSYERLVVGVAVAAADSYHIEIANSLEKLHCLYGDDSQVVEAAIEIMTETLQKDLALRLRDALTNPRPTLSQISIGECREAEGETLEKIGSSWMQMLSSLYQGVPDFTKISSNLDSATEITAESGDRLPALVLDYVIEKRGGLVDYFHPTLREHRSRRQAGRSHEVWIDFAGSKLVANFGTLRASRLSPSITVVKRRLWDLKVQRDKERGTLAPRSHEMIIQVPRRDDPQVSSRQLDNVDEALSALEEQAHQEQLRLRAMTAVADIGEHIILLEAA